ncbi:hypothetical protein COLO4_01982 [Corchorus olitorius]|uniref:Uncharacterized protein n=1 Tax=Corchorus olitorius TaxID=93759 RepID=A0A1R3L1P1_9ROSI|nr:hypothetical protein COLO4_01982 [Corchorus olitorius]
MTFCWDSVYSRLDRTCADGDRQNSSIFASDFGYD